jgi:hypothetical protein
MSDEKKKVGYGVTPEHTRVKPGQKLNPHGRPKGSKNKKTLAERFMKHADEPLEVSEQGKKSRQPSIDIAIKRLRNHALKGEDGKMLTVFLDKYEEMEKIASAVAPNSYPFSDLDKQVMDEMYRRMKLCAGDVDD